MTNTAVLPIRKRVTVNTTPDRAFELFTEGMVRWWSPEYSINQSPMQGIVMEPKAGGRWFERGKDGTQCQWGEVLTWDPPERLVLAWQIETGEQWRFNPKLVTELEVRFLPDGDGKTRVELEHRHLERYGDQAPMVREIFDSPSAWQGLLERLAEETD